jgi:hypothetical protein
LYILIREIGYKKDGGKERLLRKKFQTMQPMGTVAANDEGNSFGNEAEEETTMKW